MTDRNIELAQDIIRNAPATYFPALMQTLVLAGMEKKVWKGKIHIYVKAIEDAPEVYKEIDRRSTSG